MPFTIDHLDDGVYVWSTTEAGARYDCDEAYTPTLYVGGEEDALRSIRGYVNRLTEVERTAVESWRRGFRHDAEPMLRVDVADIESVTGIARDIYHWGAPGQYRLYNVDLSREFRYCLERAVDPTPERDLRVLELDASRRELSGDEGVSELTVEGESLTGEPPEVAAAVERRVQRRDPDVLSVSASDVLASLHETAAQQDWDYELGRLPGFQQLAGRSTYESYGRVGHSPARYNVPGRVIIDRSNSFFLSETNLEGALNLVERSRKPLQELAWASIGNVLTAIQIREARERNVLVPWKAWRPELFKTMRQLHDADRGGFIFAPEVGIHEDVHELDFSSLYPNIIITRNVSPETVRCACHRGREDVPELGYAICDERGYLPDVLEPLVRARDEIKAEIRALDDSKRVAELAGRSDAIKWILVSCFGYQGFSNAKFGRIEAHEAINAYARDIMLTAKEQFECGGWHVVHGIVDSIWVTAAEEGPTPLEELAGAITDAVGIRLEYEAAYDWVAFVPQRTSEAGALTKYFGRMADDPEYKYRGIECRQDSTPPYVADVQRELIRVLDRTRSPEAVCDRLHRYVDELRTGEVDPQRLHIDNRVTKSVDAYSRATRNVAALQRAEADGVTVHPGQHVEYVVVDDSLSSADRVRLAHEAGDRYDTAFYTGRLVRAAESVLAPLGWDESRIRRYLGTERTATLARFED